ncbi:hypothetical protein [Aquimarina spinulae]|uniref:hypothetical protein n=1 Tax=Aquimarina spinulae TaxID=1192023 RepID=UPI000D556440|nr:hypothetical protein [Aquimarina spinulae]
MYKGSEKEYELLKGEADTIRKSILQFIGFIISIAGIAVAIAKVFFNPKEDNSIIILGAIVGGLVAITFLFEVIWYKFKSHNRYVGYILLLTQEVGYVELTDEIKKRESTDDKSHLDNIKITDCPDGSYLTLFTWEYMMARLNNADFENSKLKILTAIQKIYFKFRIPDTYKYKSIKPELRDALEDNYFKNVVRLMYTPEKSFSERVLDKIHDGFWGLLDLYIPIRYSFFKKRFKRVKREYLCTGWLFPKKVIQVVFFPITLLLIFFYSVLFSNFKIASNLNFDNISYPVTFMSLLVFFISIIWVFRYVGGLKSVIFGKHSAEYFSWSFFIFRVQLLNSYDIFPIYFSQNFIRYFKSIKIIEYHNDLYNCSAQKDTDKCSICEKQKGEFLQSSPDLSLQNNNAMKKFDVICCDCSDLYKHKLISASKISKELIDFHLYIEKKLNSDPI